MKRRLVYFEEIENIHIASISACKERDMNIRHSAVSTIDTASI